MVTATKIRKNTKTTDTGITLEQHSLQPAQKELERMIEYLAKDMDFKDVHIVPVIQTQGSRQTYGHFSANRWLEGELKMHEISISAEWLARPRMEIFGTVLHELIHTKNHSLGIVDCRNHGVYHLKAFDTTGSQYGSECIGRTKGNGFGLTRLTAAKEAQILAEFKPDDSAFSLVRIAVAKAKRVKQPTTMAKWSCECSNIRAATEINATCNNCGEDFQKQ